MDDILTRTSYTLAAFLSSLSLLSVNTIALFLGMFLGFATFLLNWVYKHKTYKLQVECARMLPVDNGKQSNVP